MPKTIKEESIDKDLNVRKADSFGNYEIYRPSGGRLPKELNGIYTTPNMAKRRLDAYLETLGIIDEQKKLKEEIKSISKLDHLYDGV